ncbi:MAG: hypothetical protein ABFD97_21015 [Syntrophobacter sp.]
MLELLKKSLMAGLGAVVITRDKVREVTRTLVDEGKMSTDEAEKFADDLVKSGEREWEDINSKLQSTAKKWSDNMEVVRKKDLQDLHAKLELMEQRLRTLEEARRGESSDAPGH